MFDDEKWWYKREIEKKYDKNKRYLFSSFLSKPFLFAWVFLHPNHINIIFPLIIIYIYIKKIKMKDDYYDNLIISFYHQLSHLLQPSSHILNFFFNLRNPRLKIRWWFFISNIPWCYLHIIINIYHILYITKEDVQFFSTR